MRVICEDVGKRLLEMDGNFCEAIFEGFVFPFFKIVGRQVVFGVGEDAIFESPEGEKELSDPPSPGFGATRRSGDFISADQS